MKNLFFPVVAFVTCTALLPLSVIADSVLFEEIFAYPPSEDFRTIEAASARGWGTVHSHNVRVPERELNSPWSFNDLSNSVRIYHDGGQSSSLFLSLATALPQQGQLTADKQPAGLTFSWDFRTTTIMGNNRNRAQFLIGSGTVSSLRHDPAIRIFVSGGDQDSFSYRDGSESRTTGAGTFRHNSWYRFEVFDIAIAGGTYGLRIFNEDLPQSPIYERTGIRFANPVSVLGGIRFNHIFATTDNRWYNIDNVQIRSRQ